MASHDWSNSIPISQATSQYYSAAQSSPSSGHEFPNHHGTFGSPYSVYSRPSTPYAPTTDPRLRLPFSVPGYGNVSNISAYGNMDNKALATAALTPSPNRMPSQQLSISRLTTTSSQCRTGVLNSKPPPASSPLSEMTDGDFSSETEHHPTLYPAKQHKPPNKRKHAQITGSDQEYQQDEQDVDEETPARAPKTRRSTRARGATDSNDINYAGSLPARGPTTKATRGAKAPKSTPRRMVRRKPHGIRVPETLDKAGPADRMMWEWKNSGRGWEDIRNEWGKITGTKPGQSSLSVRYIKLNENFARNGAAGDLELLKFRKEAEQELMTGLWDKVAEKMLAFNPLSEYNPKDLRRRHELLVRSGYDIEKVAAEDGKMDGKADRKMIQDPTVNKAEHNIDADLINLDHSNGVHPASHTTGGHTFMASTAIEESSNHNSHALTGFRDGTTDAEDAYGRYPVSMPELPRAATTQENDLAGISNEVSVYLTSDATQLPTSPTGPVTLSPAGKGLVSYASDSD